MRISWDLDNTLANSGALIRVGQRLQEAVVDAKPVPNMLEFYRTIQRRLPDAEHFVLSARPRVMRHDTLVWLRRHAVGPTDGAVCFVPYAEAKLKVWQQLARDARLVIVDDLSYNHEHDRPTIYRDLVELAQQTACVYVGFYPIGAIAASSEAIEAIASQIVKAVTV